MLVPYCVCSENSVFDWCRLRIARALTRLFINVVLFEHAQSYSFNVLEQTSAHGRVPCIMLQKEMCCNVRKGAFGYVRPAKIQTSLIRIWSTLAAFWTAKDARCLHVDNEDSDQTAGCAGWFGITKTCLYNVDPLKPHFYIIKRGFTGYTLFFLFLLKTEIVGTR